jgi:UDP-glucose 4-epimerase
MDLADGHLSALDYVIKNTGFIAVNLGTGKGSSVLQVVASFRKASGKSIPFKIVERRAGDVAQSFADPSKALRLLNWRARLDLDAMCIDSWRFQSMTMN